MGRLVPPRFCQQVVDRSKDADCIYGRHFLEQVPVAILNVDLRKYF